MKNITRRMLALVLTFAMLMSMSAIVQAADPLTLPDLISDNMLIQRDMPIKLWGFGGIEGEELTVKIFDKNGKAVRTGSTVIKTGGGFEAEFEALTAGGPYEITFSDPNGKVLKTVKNVLVGELWFQGGQSNMEWKILSIPADVEERVNPNPKDDTIRLFYNSEKITAETPAENLKGEWIVADKNTEYYSAVGYGALEVLSNELKVPVGGICSPYGGSGIQSQTGPNGNIYKAKIAPVTKMNIRGVMWYQGEFDRNDTIEVYEQKMNNFISSMRNAWNNEKLPVVFAQLPASPWKTIVYNTTDQYQVNDYSRVRVAQSNVAVTDKNTAMAVTLDISITKYRDRGEDPIHFWAKKPVADRMGKAALELAYSKDVKSKSPVLSEYEINGDTVTVTFDNTYDGLKTSDGGEPKGFMVAGADGVYYEAKATISGNKVSLKSDKVKAPVSASYGFEQHYWPYTDHLDLSNAPEVAQINVNVVNSQGLPMGTFDTTKSKVKSDIAPSVPEVPETSDDASQVVQTPVTEAGDRTILYIAPNGDDANAGTIDAPFASLEKARDTIREMKNSGKLAKGGAVVYLRGGEYLVQKAFELTAEDSGSKDAPIIYRNYPDEKVTFTGAANLNWDDFKKVTDTAVLDRLADKNAKGKIMEADLFAFGFTELPELSWPGAYSYSWGMQQVHGKEKPEGVAPELIVNGNAMTIARYPNSEYMFIDTVVEPGENVRNWYDDRIGQDNYIKPEDRKTTPFTITIDDNRLTYWENAEEALITGLFFYSWADQTVPIAKVEGDKKRITSVYPSEYTVKSGQSVYVYNLIEELDSPGEYYVDRKAGKLYYYPISGSIDSVIYTTLEEYMFELKDCEYVTIKGIDMNYMRSGAVRMTETNNCNLIGCEINYTGNMAVSITGEENTVKDCYIHDVEGGVTAQGGDRNTLTPGNNVIENNEFERCDRISKTYKQAANINGVGNYIIHNELHDSSHVIVGFGGNDQVIAFNEIYDAVKYADDMGAIYAGRNLTCRGNLIYHNYFHDIGGAETGSIGVQAVFLDDWFSEAEMKGNVFENVKGAAIKLAGSHNKIDNNVFVNVTQQAGQLNRSYNYGNPDSEYTYRQGLADVPYLSEIWVKKYPEIVNVVDENNKLDMNNYIVATDNVLYKTQDFVTSAQVAATATVEDNVIFSNDPGFYNMEKRNYLLNPDAEVYEKIPDFEPILFTRMGRYSDRAIDRISKAYAFCVDSPYIYKEGNKTKSDKTEAIVENGIIYIPLRSGASAVGGEISYDEATEKISLSTGIKTMEFTDGEKDKVMINGIEYKLKAPIVNINYTNYISVGDLAEIFERHAIINNNLAVISETENLFNFANDEGILRYIEEQLTLY